MFFNKVFYIFLSVSFAVTLANGQVAKSKVNPSLKSLGKDTSKTKTDTTKKKELKNYNELLKKAKSWSGMFKVHQVEADYYFEIPLSLMEADFLLVNKLSSVPLALNESGLNKGMNFENKVIRFTHNPLTKTVWVKTIVPQVESASGDAITQSVRDNFIGSVIESFKIESYNPDGR